MYKIGTEQMEFIKELVKFSYSSDKVSAVYYINLKKISENDIRELNDIQVKILNKVRREYIKSLKQKK